MERREDLSTADLAEDRPRDEVRTEPRRERDVLAEGAAVPPGVEPVMEHAVQPTEERVDERVEQRVEQRVDERPPDQPLLAPGDAERFQARWTDVQNGFVDAPRRAVEDADNLVAELMQHLARTFADERARLEGQWDRGDEVSTDELRVAFQRYRVFFGRLLST
jgi:hypothetical protein